MIDIYTAIDEIDYTKKMAGIYAIINKKNGKIYIGRSLNLRQRILGHRCQIIKEKHSVNQLQSDLARIGPSKFKFKVLDVVDPHRKNIENFLLAREYYWMMKVGPHHLYNAEIPNPYVKQRFPFSRRNIWILENLIRLDEDIEKINLTTLIITRLKEKGYTNEDIMILTGLNIKVVETHCKKYKNMLYHNTSPEDVIKSVLLKLQITENISNKIIKNYLESDSLPYYL